MMPQRHFLVMAPQAAMAPFAGLPAHAKGSAERMPADAQAAEIVAPARENWRKRK